MKLSELKTQLLAHPGQIVTILLPDGGRVPRHFHVTEVGHVAKKFVDCGGTFRAHDACVLQTWTGTAADDGHRLQAGRLAHILGLAHAILPTDELPVEVEYEDGIVSQFPLMEITASETELTLLLGLKHTDCLAREQCGVGEGGDCATEPEAACCGGKKTGCCRG
jgi:hypothetical protein